MVNHLIPVIVTSFLCTNPVTLSHTPHWSFSNNWLIVQQNANPSSPYYNPNGPDPHGDDPHDEIHDKNLPANQEKKNYKAPEDVHGRDDPYR